MSPNRKRPSCELSRTPEETAQSLGKSGVKDGRLVEVIKKSVLYMWKCTNSWLKRSNPAGSDGKCCDTAPPAPPT